MCLPRHIGIGSSSKRWETCASTIGVCYVKRCGVVHVFCALCGDADSESLRTSQNPGTMRSTVTCGQCNKRMHGVVGVACSKVVVQAPTRTNVSTSGSCPSRKTKNLWVPCWKPTSKKATWKGESTRALSAAHIGIPGTSVSIVEVRQEQKSA